MASGMITAMAGLAIEPALPSDRLLLENLTQLYLHDFSAFHADTAVLDLGDDGRFDPDPPLDRWWQAHDHVPLLLRWHGRLAGFALINADSQMDAPVDHAIAEFFIVRKYRRSGLGLATAHAIFNRWPGAWEAAVMRANIGARLFWDRAVRSHGEADNIAVHDRRDTKWDGLVFRFRIAPA